MLTRGCTGSSRRVHDFVRVWGSYFPEIVLVKSDQETADTMNHKCRRTKWSDVLMARGWDGQRYGVVVTSIKTSKGKRRTGHGRVLIQFLAMPISGTLNTLYRSFLATFYHYDICPI